MSDSRTGTQNIQNEPGPSSRSRKLKSAQKIKHGDMPKKHKSQSERALNDEI